jgi:hypothetical protein
MEKKQKTEILGRSVINIITAWSYTTQPPCLLSTDDVSTLYLHSIQSKNICCFWMPMIFFSLVYPLFIGWYDSHSLYIAE